MNIVLLLVGIASLIFGSFQFFKARKLVRNGINVSAEIIEIRQKESQSQGEDGFNSTSYSYAPVFEFEAKDGKKYTVESNHGFANKNKFKVGEMVDVVYLEEKPQNASIKKFGSLWSLPLILIFLGIMFIALSFSS